MGVREKKEPVIGNGYYWLNAVMADKKEICPVHGEIARRIRTTRRYVSERSKKVQFDVGIRKIYLGKETLWLVVSRQADKSDIPNFPIKLNLQWPPF